MGWVGGGGGGLRVSCGGGGGKWRRGGGGGRGEVRSGERTRQKLAETRATWRPEGQMFGERERERGWGCWKGEEGWRGTRVG